MKQTIRIALLTVAAFATATICSASLAGDSVIVKPDIVYSTKQQNYLLGGFVVDGVTNYDQDLLRNIAELTEGQAITVPGADITNVLQRYWKQKIFSDVSISADSIVGNKIFLHITLTARPKISTINYHGVKKSQREDIEQRLGLKAGSQISPDIIDRAKIIIKRYFEEKGYQNAKVEIVQQDDVSAANQAILDINIDRNEKIKVKHIYFTGVEKGSVKKLKKAMKKTHEVNKLATMFRAKSFSPKNTRRTKVS